MIISSTAFENNGTIPIKYTGFGKDVSPAFTLSDVPQNTVSFALIMNDLDVPFCKIFTHWIVWNIPVTETIPEGLPNGAFINTPLTACQGVAWGRHIYRGPKQPFFVRGEHRYLFTLYALDCKLDIPASSKRKELLTAMTGHILATASITGKFKRGSKSK